MNNKMNACIICFIAIGTLAIFAMDAPANAASSGSTNANVTVTSTISITITGGPLVFGSLNAGATNQAPSPNNITIGVDSVTNVATNIYQYASNFSDGGSHNFSISNLKYWSDGTLANAIGMPLTQTSPTLTAWQNVTAGNSVNAYYWLSIPNAQYPATYTTTINIVGSSS